MTSLDLHDTVEKLPSQMQEAVILGKEFVQKYKAIVFSEILFSGMGGSAISGDIFRSLAAPESKIPWHVNRSENIPAWVGPKTLAFFSSYSGKTQETRSALNQAIKRKAKIVAVSSGGEIAQTCVKYGIPFLQIPKGLPPRFALGYLTFSPIPFLNKIGAVRVRDRDLRETAIALLAMKRSVAKKIAKVLFGKYAHFYAAGILEPAAVRWHTQLAENAKYLSSHQSLPEMFHNEIEGWKLPARIVRDSVAVFFKDASDSKTLLRKTKFAAQAIKKAGGSVLEIQSSGSSPVTRLFSLIFLGDRVSLELARMACVNPYEVPLLEAIKKIQ